MKHMIKFCAVFCAALSLVVFAGCMYPNADIEKNGGLRISVNDNVGRATMYPSANFTKITLSFVNTSGSATYQNVNLDIHSKYTTINDLPDGSWKITATGYVKIGDTEYPAANGEQTITVSGNSFQSINISISARHDGADGFLSYDIDFPSVVTDAQLYIFDIRGNYYDHHGVTSRDIKNDRVGRISHAPGFYMMSVRMTTPYRTVAWTEVIHIYSNMETTVTRVFTEDDLTRLVTAGGNANVTINAMPPDWANIYFYRDSNYEDYFDQTFIDNGKWSLAIPALSQATTLYVMVVIHFAGNYYELKLNDTITLHTGHESYGDINHNFTDSFIIVSGTANFTINAEVPSGRVSVRVEKWNDDWSDWQYASDNYIDVNNSTYILFLSEELLNERIQIFLWNILKIDELELNSTTITHNINFHAADKVILRGDIDFKVCGEYPSYLEIIIKNNWGDELNWGSFAPHGTWELEIEAPAYPEDVYIWIWTPETESYDSGLYETVSAEVFSVPTQSINKTVNINIDVPQTTRGGVITAFDTNDDLSFSVPATVRKGVTLHAQVFNRREYDHNAVITYTWFINGALQDVVTDITSDRFNPHVGTTYLPTANLTVGKQYGLVVVSIDGAAFAKEFSFQVNE